MTESLAKIEALEPIARQLEPGPDLRLEYLSQVNQRTEEFLEAIPHTKAYNWLEDKGAGLLNHPFAEEPNNIEQLLDWYDRHVNQPGLNPASGGHLAYIPGGGLYASALGDFIAAVTNRYAGVFFGGPGAVRMENMCVRWCADLIGYPEGAAGALHSGGSIANLSCIVTARDAQGIKSVDVPRAVIYLTEQVHHCVTKALRIAGLGESHVQFVPVDDQFRMDPDALATLIRADKAAGRKPFLVVASAGTTDTGAVDPIDEMGRICEEEDLWFHVDAAYGGFFILCEEGRKVIHGMERANSVVMDPHKSLFLPYGIGVAVVRDGQALAQSHQYTANYLQDALQLTDEASPADLSPELTKHFRGLRMWLPLQLHGVGVFRVAVEEKLWLARYFWEKLPELPHIDRGPFPDLSVVLYRFTPPGIDANDFNNQLINRCQHDGRVFLSSTRINGDTYLRMVSLAFRTHRDTIELCLQMLRENVEALVEEFAAK